MTADELDSLKEDGAKLSKKEQAAVHYSAEVVRSGTVKDETFARLHEFFDTKEIMELTFLACDYLGTAHFLAALQVDIEPDYAAELRDGQID